MSPTFHIGVDGRAAVLGTAKELFVIVRYAFVEEAMHVPGRGFSKYYVCSPALRSPARTVRYFISRRNTLKRLPHKEAGSVYH
jgi:hypothetical protein